jgi:hypothetical protein
MKAIKTQFVDEEFRQQAKANLQAVAHNKIKNIKLKYSHTLIY